MIDNDQEVNKIVQKVLGKGKNQKYSKKNLSMKYESSNERTDSSYRNYELQNSNSNLRQQYKKLQNIFKKRAKKQQVHRSLLSEIEEVKEKLKKCLNQNQTLELSLCRMRTKTVTDKAASQHNSLQDCCCSRSRKMFSRNNTKFITKQSPKQEKIDYETFRAQTNVKPFISVQDKGQDEIKTEDIGISCLFESLEDEKNNIKSKKQYIAELQQIMEKQNKIIFEYERDLKEKSKVGKFAKTADIKTQRIKSSQSIGMFVKTKNKGKK